MGARTLFHDEPLGWTVAADYLRVTLATAGQLHELELERMAASPR